MMKLTYVAALLVALMVPSLASAQTPAPEYERPDAVPQLSAEDPMRSQLSALEIHLGAAHFREMGSAERARVRKMAAEIGQGLAGQDESVALTDLDEPQRSKFIGYHDTINAELRKAWLASVVSCRNVHVVGSNRASRKCMSNAARRAQTENARDFMLDAMPTIKLVNE